VYGQEEKAGRRNQASGVTWQTRSSWKSRGMLRRKMRSRRSNLSKCPSQGMGRARCAQSIKDKLDGSLTYAGPVAWAFAVVAG